MEDHCAVAGSAESTSWLPPAEFRDMARFAEAPAWEPRPRSTSGSAQLCYRLELQIAESMSTTECSTSRDGDRNHPDHWKVVEKASIVGKV